jgi:NADPH:quinone reductase-like Zn-dependent oxidoreductase
MPTLNTTNALVLDAERRTAFVQQQLLPGPDPTDLENASVRIKVCAIALNPVDALYVASPLGRTGRVIGSDFAGFVDLEPNGPSTLEVHEGDRVAGFLQGASSINERPGAFAGFIHCPVDLLWRVPSYTSLEAAAGMSLCGLTAAQALFYRLGLTAPFVWNKPAGLEATSGVEHSEHRHKPWFFIYGASTSVGMYAAQLVRRSAESSGTHIRLIGAASKARHDMLKDQPYGYDELVDYRANDWQHQVMSLTEGRGVDWAFDCISEGLTVRDVATTLRPGGKMAIVRSREGGAWDTYGLRKDVEPSYGAVWEGLGKYVLYKGMALPASREARAFTAAFYRWLSGGGKLEPNPIRLMPGGLENVVSDGFTLLGCGSMEDRGKERPEAWMKPVSAEKLVYRLR